MMDAYLRGLTDKQLIRINRKVRERIERGFAGGLAYGWDYPTLRVVMPGFYTVVKMLARENKRRGLV